VSREVFDVLSSCAAPATGIAASNIAVQNALQMVLFIVCRCFFYGKGISFPPSGEYPKLGIFPSYRKKIVPLQLENGSVQSVLTCVYGLTQRRQF
jgi:hypothetical protein